MDILKYSQQSYVHKSVATAWDVEYGYQIIVAIIWI